MDLRSAEPCSSPPACQWPGSEPPGSDPARSQRSGSSSAAGEPPPRPMGVLEKKIINNYKSKHYMGVACVNKIYVLVIRKPLIMFFVTLNGFRCVRGDYLWGDLWGFYGGWLAYLFGAGVGIACLLFADESALQSSVLVDFHRLHLLLDGIHGVVFVFALLYSKETEIEMEIQRYENGSASDWSRNSCYVHPIKQLANLCDNHQLLCCE